MPEVPCPVPDCPYITPDVGDVTGGALITGHMTSHTSTPPPPVATPPAHIPTTNTKLEPFKVQHPNGSTSSTGGRSIRWPPSPLAPTESNSSYSVATLTLTFDWAGWNIDGPTHGGTSPPSHQAPRSKGRSCHRCTPGHEARQGRAFATRVKGQAATCQLAETCTCGRDVSFSERMQRHVILRGLADTQIRREMMCENKSLRRLITTRRPEIAPTPKRLDASSYKRQGKRPNPPRHQ